MKSVPLQAITLPILMDAPTDDAEGWIGMPTLRGYTLRSVRTVRSRDIPPLRGRARSLNEAIASLRSALSRREPVLLKDAIEAAEPFLELPGVRTEYDWSDMSLERLVPATRWTYSFLMSFALRDVQMVIWSPRNGLKPPAPAMYCPNDASAAFALLAMAQVRLCANRKCRVAFTPSPPRQIYHTEQCGIAERVRRSRKNTVAAIGLLKANPRLSLRDAVALLAKHKINRGKDWVKTARHAIAQRSKTIDLRTTVTPLLKGISSTNARAACPANRLA